ncbi:MAG TPA: response regulator [Nitrospira sp.]
MVRHPSILLIEDSSGERELFRLALKQTGLEIALFTEQDAEAAFHFLEDQCSFQARSCSSSEGGLNWSPTARTFSPAQPQARQDAPFPEEAHSDRAASASKGDQSGYPSPLPSLILLDWHLGKQRGDEFLKRLRTDSRLATIPVVVFTTSDDASDLSLAYAGGANGYVMKPGTFDDLIQCTGDICRFWLARNLAPHMVETKC